MSDLGARISEAMTTICAEIPKRFDIRTFLQEAFNRISKAAEPDEVPQQFMIDKVTEVLREIATHAVDEFTRRTGQPFLWVDEPELPPDPEPLMTFSLDDKGNVTF